MSRRAQQTHGLFYLRHLRTPSRQLQIKQNDYQSDGKVVAEAQKRATHSSMLSRRREQNKLKIGNLVIQDASTGNNRSKMLDTLTPATQSPVKLPSAQHSITGTGMTTTAADRLQQIKSSSNQRLRLTKTQMSAGPTAYSNFLQSIQGSQEETKTHGKAANKLAQIINYESLQILPDASRSKTQLKTAQPGKRQPKHIGVGSVFKGPVSYSIQ